MLMFAINTNHSNVIAVTKVETSVTVGQERIVLEQHVVGPSSMPKWDELDAELALGSVQNKSCVCSWYVIGQGALGETCRDMKRVSQIKCC
jgi:hypothetical protein